MTEPSLPGMESTAGDELVTLTCDEIVNGKPCGAQITGTPKGKGSAQWKLGTHKYNVHKIKGRPKAKANAAADDMAAAPVLGVVRDIADAARGRGVGVPSSDDLAKGLGRGLTFASIGFATLAVDTDPRLDFSPESQDIRNRLIDDLSIPVETSTAVIGPIARIMAPTRLNVRYGRAVVDNADAVASVFDLTMVVRNWSRYFRERNEWVAANRPNPAPIMTAPNTELYHPPYGHVPTAADLEGITTPAPTAGKVMTAADVEALHRNRGN